MRWTPLPPRPLRYTGRVLTRVLPSPVFISATQPKCSAAPPISCTSKWRWPMTRAGRLAGDGERLDQQVVERRAVGRAARGTRRSCACSASSAERCDRGSSALMSGTRPWSALSFLPSPARRMRSRMPMRGIEPTGDLLAGIVRSQRGSPARRRRRAGRPCRSVAERVATRRCSMRRHWARRRGAHPRNSRLTGVTRRRPQPSLFGAGEPAVDVTFGSAPAHLARSTSPGSITRPGGCSGGDAVLAALADALRLDAAHRHHVRPACCPSRGSPPAGRSGSASLRSLTAAGAAARPATAWTSATNGRSTPSAATSTDDGCGLRGVARATGSGSRTENPRGGDRQHRCAALVPDAPDARLGERPAGAAPGPAATRPCTGRSATATCSSSAVPASTTGSTACPKTAQHVGPRLSIMFRHHLGRPRTRTRRRRAADRRPGRRLTR